MNFLQKLDLLLQQHSINKSELSKACGIPYTTIDGWYKKGYEGLKLSTLKKLAVFFNTSLDYWAAENYTPDLTEAENIIIKNYRLLDERGKAVVLDVMLRELQYTNKKEIDAVEIIDTLKTISNKVNSVNTMREGIKK